MRRKWMRPSATIALAVLLVTLSTTWLLAGDKKRRPTSANGGQMWGTDRAGKLDERQRAIHALNRLTFGPRPGDVDRVLAMGVDKWIDLQLHPNKIDDSALDARLAQFRTLKMQPREMIAEFPPPQLVKQVADGKRSMPSDPEKRAVYEAAVAKYKAKQEKKQEDNAEADQGQGQGQDQGQQPHPSQQMARMGHPSERGAPTVVAAAEGDQDEGQQPHPSQQMARMGHPGPEVAPTAEADQDQGQQPHPSQPMARMGHPEAREQARQDADRLLAMQPDDRMNAILKMQPEERARLVRVLGPQERMQILDGMSPKQKETLLALANPQAVIPAELMQAKLERAVYSDRQLEEVMTDFWFNHFNVFIGKGPDRYLITSYERDVIRPHAMGKFKDLLMATAQSPAMLFYLDNWQSVGPNSQAALNRDRMANGEMPQRLGRRGRFGGRQLTPQQQDRLKQAAQKAPKGLNENYAREVMELHTLGVNGGYTQKDVTELAKILTGWSIEQPRQGGGFRYNERVHEPGTKYFLGKKFKDDGEKEGEQALEMLASSPATAKFVSRKLAMRFVSDNPPEALVDRMAETFRKSDGDIREVLHTMFKSKEFWAPETYHAKVKTPLEFVASALRATNADVENGLPLVQQLNKMGMPLYGAQPPTGYSMKAETWVNSAALLDRMNFALALGVGRLPGVKVNLGNAMDSPTLSPTKGDKGRAQDGDKSGAQLVLASLENSLLNGEVSQQTHETIEKRLADPAVSGRKLDDAPRPVVVGAVAGLILGSPEFQKR